MNALFAFRSLTMATIASVSASGLFAPSAYGQDQPNAMANAHYDGEQRPSDIEHVIAISIDGFGGIYAQRYITEGMLPTFKRFVDEGAHTVNARTDADYAITLPNHTAMVTGRPVKGNHGHHWTDNGDPKDGETLHSNRGEYISTMFHVAHDHGMSTGLWSGKSKFSLFDTSCDHFHGLDDLTGEDDGKDKLDVVFVHRETYSQAVGDNFIEQMTERPLNLAFLHFRDPDSAGHAHGWGSEEYKKALREVDVQLARIFEMVETNEDYKDKTIIILTADHGGHGRGHGNMADPLDYVVPFFAWGHGVTEADLYALNPETRINPGLVNIPFSAERQPIRNGDLGNLSLDLLGLPAIPGSTINVRQDLEVEDE